jgi:hypothetical protein
MIIGVPKEIKNNENRVGMTPSGVAELVKRGHTVYIQHTAGENSGFPDEAYIAAGAQILPTMEETYAAAQMIVKVKEPIAPEYKLIRKGQLLFTYFHFASDKELTLAMIENGSICLAYETVEKADHSLPLLIPAVREATTLPLIAAGGIGTGEAIFATMALGAEGVQIGTRFALTDESSASDIFKEYCLRLNEGDTKLLLKKLAPTRLVTNSFRDKVEVAEARGASAEELRELLGRGRAKKGIFEGDLEEGELEIGQVAALFRRRQSVDEVMKELLEGYRRASDKVSSFLL